MSFWELHYHGTMKIVISTLNIVKFTQIFPSVYGRVNLLFYLFISYRSLVHKVI